MSSWYNHLFAIDPRGIDILIDLQSEDFIGYFPDFHDPYLGVDCRYNSLSDPKPTVKAGQNNFGKGLKEVGLALHDSWVYTTILVMDSCKRDGFEYRYCNQKVFSETILVVYTTGTTAAFCASLLEALLHNKVKRLLLMCGTRDKAKTSFESRGTVKLETTLNRLGHIAVQYPGIEHVYLVGVSEVRKRVEYTVLGKSMKVSIFAVSNIAMFELVVHREQTKLCLTCFDKSIHSGFTQK